MIEYEHFEMLFERWTDARGFKAMNAKVTVLPKRELNYKLNLVSNQDWEKRFEFFWALT